MKLLQALTWWQWLLAAIVILGVAGAITSGSESEDTKQKARDEAEQIVAQAEREAKRIRDRAQRTIDAAEREADDIKSAAVEERDEAREELEDAQEKTSETRTDRRAEQRRLDRLRVQVRSARTIARKSSFEGDGTFVVGEDILPGTYRASASPTGNCYWARLSSIGGNGADNIIENENTSGQTVMQIAPTDAAVEVSGCATFKRSG